jgi:hypothetical protein
MELTALQCNVASVGKLVALIRQGAVRLEGFTRPGLDLGLRVMNRVTWPQRTAKPRRSATSEHLVVPWSALAMNVMRDSHGAVRGVTRWSSWPR